jgi:hypothetical protein
MAFNLKFEGQGAVIKGQATVALASVASGAVTECTVSVVGALLGDIVHLAQPAAGITAGLIVAGARVSAADTVKVRVANLSGATVAEPSGTWDYVLIRS